MLDKRKLLHGVSKEARKFELHFGAEPPATGGTTIPVWIRDGWEVEEKTVVADARAAGEASPLVCGFIPRSAHAEDMKRAVASYYAATATLESKGTPNTPEGIEAKRAMETRQEQAKRSRDSLLTDILNETAIYIGGGDPVPGILLEEKVQDAAKSCLDRLYPQFHQADSPDWYKAIERSKKGDGDALEVVGHKGDPENHAVCSALLGFVGSGKKGTEIRKAFTAPPYGWPQDAIDAALIVLFNGGLLQARSGGEPVPKQKLDQKNIAAAEFRVEQVTLSKVQLIGIRKVFEAVAVKSLPSQESAKAPEFLTRMKTFAQKSGGPPPLPPQPDCAHLEDIGNRVGNDQLNPTVLQPAPPSSRHARHASRFPSRS